MIPALLALAMAGTPKVGELAPEFTVTDTDGKSHTLSEMVNTGPVILAFIVKSSTSG